MPRRRKYRKKNTTYWSRKPKYYRAFWESFWDLNPDTAREVLAFVFLAIAIITLLAIFKLAGNLGNFWYGLLRLVVGLSTIFIPLLLGWISIALFYPEKYKIEVVNFLGLILFLTSFSGIFHLFIPQNEAWEIAKAGSGGGYLGFWVALVLKPVLNVGASLVVLIILLLISILVIFNTSFSSLKRKVKPRAEKAARLIKKPIHINQPKASQAKTQTPLIGELQKIKEFDLKNLPSLELLDDTISVADSGDIRRNADIIKKTLSHFGIEVEMTDVNVGPTVTQYTLKPNEGVKLNKITALNNDLALALAAHPIRIEAPIPGKSLVGIEVPNKVKAIVRLREVLESSLFFDSKSPLIFALGKDVAGIPLTADLDKMPHLLIAGATGSGKSICINSIILSLLYKNNPSNLRVILIDPKRVELTNYNGIPHLLTPVVTEPEKTISALKWVVLEMERRYKLFEANLKRDIISYNKTPGFEKLPYLVTIIDELADLMALAPQEVEHAIVRLSQMARATGIHLVIATQRPSVDVITGLIKANITNRIAFATASQVDSRTILDMAGAEKLLGLGDMLYLAGDISKPKRIQGSFVSEKEIKNVVGFWKEQGEPQYDEKVLTIPTKSTVFGEIPDDELFSEAAEVVFQSGKASASLLQRRLRIGYARAARLLDLLEERGVVGPADGAKPREILINDLSEIEELEENEE